MSLRCRLGFHRLRFVNDGSFSAALAGPGYYECESCGKQAGFEGLPHRHGPGCGHGGNLEAE